MSDDQEAYAGVVGAFSYAYRSTDSLTFRSYAAISGGVVVLMAVLFFLLALPVWVADTLGGSAIQTLSRAFLVVVWLAAVAPMMAPVLVVARRHRHGRDADPRYEPALAVAGYLYMLSGYLALLIAVPAGQRETPPAAVAPVVEFLYSLPPEAAVVPPLLAVGLMAAAHFAFR